MREAGKKPERDRARRVSCKLWAGDGGMDDDDPDEPGAKGAQHRDQD